MAINMDISCRGVIIAMKLIEKGGPRSTNIKLLNQTMASLFANMNLTDVSTGLAHNFTAPLELAVALINFLFLITVIASSTTQQVA
jgi:hypothetical protein